MKKTKQPAKYKSLPNPKKIANVEQEQQQAPIIQQQEQAPVIQQQQQAPIIQQRQQNVVQEEQNFNDLELDNVINDELNSDDSFNDDSNAVATSELPEWSKLQPVKLRSKSKAEQNAMPQKMAMQKGGRKFSKAEIKNVNLADLASKNTSGFHNPHSFMDFFKTVAKPDSLSMANLSQVNDFLFYWPRFMPNTFRFVTQLDISYCFLVTDLGIRWIAYYFPSLTDLNASGCRYLTEYGLKIIMEASKNKSDKLLNFDYTSVRCLPELAPNYKVQTKGCPLICDSSKNSKVKGNSEKSPALHLAEMKILIIKPISMHSKSIGPQVFPPDSSDITGDPSVVTYYRSKNKAVIECCEDFPGLDLLITDNCFVILPFDPKDKTTIADSLEARFNRVISLTTKTFAIVVSIENSGLVDESVVTTVKQSLEEKINRANADQKETSNFPTNKELSRYGYLLNHDIVVATSTSDALNYLEKKASSLTYNDIKHQANAVLQVAEKAVAHYNSTFSTQEHFVHSSSSTSTSQKLDIKPNWSSVAAVLNESGNLWLEPSSPTNSKSVLTTMQNFIKFLNSFHQTSNSTAMSEDVQCLAVDTPLGSSSQIRKMVHSPQLTEEAIARFFNILEFSGFAIFRQKSTLAMTQLRSDPPIPLEHFCNLNAPSHSDYLIQQQQATQTQSNKKTQSQKVRISKRRRDEFAQDSGENKLGTTSLTLEYPVMISPSSIFPNLVTNLVKILPPYLLWKSGVYFCESSFLDILVTFDDTKRVVTVRFSGEPFAMNHLDPKVNNQTISDRLRRALKGSCSTIHSVCCLILAPFSVSKLSILGRRHGINFVPFPVARHSMKWKTDESSIELFSRQFDSSFARCSECLLDVKTLSGLHSLFSRRRSNLIGTEVLTLKSSANPAVKSIPIANWLTPDIQRLGYQGIEPSYVDIMSTEHLQSVEIYLDPKEAIKLTFPNSKTVECSVKRDSEVSKKNTGSNPKIPHEITSGIRIDFFPKSNAVISTVISVNGQSLFEHSLPIVKSRIMMQFYSNQKTPTSVPIYCHSLTAGKASTDIKIGMKLEAVDIKTPSLICVATVTDVGEDGNWLIHFDGWSEHYDYWTQPNAKELFPCGFMEYAAKNSVLENIDQDRNRQMNKKLQVPHGSSYKSDPFPWVEYLRMVQEKEANINAIPVPLHYFEISHLHGFDGAIDLAEFSFEPPDVFTLSSFCVAARPSILMNISNDYEGPAEKNIFRHTRYVTLPEPVSWKLCCWPSRELLTNGDVTSPFFLCSWPDFIHFVNESSDKLGIPHVSINAQSPLALAIVLLKIMQQPRFLPDNFDQIFPELMTDCPYAFPSMANSNRTPVRQAEHCLRQFLIPFLLDYLTIHSSFAEQVVRGSEVYFPVAVATSTITERAIQAVERYSRYLHAEGSSVSRWSAVTVHKEKQLPQCFLLNMMEAESELFMHDSYCPKLLCGQHAYHYTKYSDVDDEDSSPNEWKSLRSQYGSFHDVFITMCAMNYDDYKGLKAPLTDIHPYLYEYLGSMSTSLFKSSGILAGKWLTELLLFRNNLKDLPDELVQLAPTLESLDLSYNPMEKIPKVVYELKNLDWLRLDFVPLRAIDDKISQLQKLKTLSLRNNCIAFLPATFKELTALESLDISGLPPLPVAKETYIEEIGTFFHKNSFPKEAATYLAQWEASDSSQDMNQAAIEDLNTSLFANLPRLKIGSEGFPTELLSLPELRRLTIANQPIKTVPDDIEKLINLNRLDLSGCRLLKKISPNVGNCPLQSLNLANCPILQTPPPEIRKRGFVATLAYFRRLAQGSVTCKRTKLMFVGLGGAGKTSLVHSLLEDESSKSSTFEVTDGIDINKWLVDTKDGTVDFRMWDFAGQVVYYNTHQFFISSRAVYLLLWNIRLGHEHAGLDFWLSSIACHAPNAPIIIIGTHADEVSQERSFLPEKNYRERYDSICGFHYVSSWTGQGIPELRKNIIEVGLSQKHMGEAVPVAWLNFEQKLLDKEYQEDYKIESHSSAILMFDRVVKSADACGIYDLDEIDQALNFLSDLGTIQYFRTDFLRDRVIIDPQWIVDVMSNVVSVKKMNVTDGRLSHKDVGSIWESYPKPLHNWLLRLTEAFDLTFPLKKEPVSIVPCLLPEDPPDSLNWPNLEDKPGFRQTKLVFSFKYLPTGLFNRVQVRLCQFSDDGATVWRRGSLLKKSTHLALLTQPNPKTIKVKVQGPCPENIAFLILEVVDTLIVDAFQGVQPDYLFACPACVNARASDPSMFERSRIRRASELRIPFLQCWNYFHSVSTEELRQLFPAESSAEFDTQFSRTIQEISNIKDGLRIDILVIGCSADSNPKMASSSVSTPEIGKDIQKSFPDLSVVVIADPDVSSDALSFDQLSVMMRSAKLIIYCLSEEFMTTDRCQATFFTGSETLRKPFLLIFIRDFEWSKYHSLQFQMQDAVYVKAITRSRYKSSDIPGRIRQRLQEINKTIAGKNMTKKKHPDVFISYSWHNSQDAVDKGTKIHSSSSLGVTDPRNLKKFLADHDIDCWIDIEQIGLGGLFQNIADGICHSKCVVVCVSDEYVKSENCLREFSFATVSVKIPVILCPVGTGGEWQTSQVNLIVCQKAPFINFQIDKKENYDTLLETVQKYVKKPQFVELSENAVVNTTMPLPRKIVSLKKAGKFKTMSDIQHEDDDDEEKVDSSTEQKSIVLQEMIQLGQRKFIHQLNGFISSMGDGKSYPRLLIADVQPVEIDDKEEAPPKEIDEKEEATSKECELEEVKSRSEEDDVDADVDEDADADAVGKLRWCARYLCEHEGGWHPTGVKIPVKSKLISPSAAYFSQIFSFIKHLPSATLGLELFSEENEDRREVYQAALAEFEKLNDTDDEFGDDYIKFREIVMLLDDEQATGDLQKCQLTVGKELWLCPEHLKSDDYTLLSRNAELLDFIDEEEENAATDGTGDRAGRQRGRKPAGRPQMMRETTQAHLVSTKKERRLDDSQIISPQTTTNTKLNTSSRACSIQ